MFKIFRLYWSLSEALARLELYYVSYFPSPKTLLFLFIKELFFLHVNLDFLN